MLPRAGTVGRAVTGLGKTLRAVGWDTGASTGLGYCSRFTPSQLAVTPNAGPRARASSTGTCQNQGGRCHD